MADGGSSAVGTALRWRQLARRRNGERMYFRRVMRSLLISIVDRTALDPNQVWESSETFDAEFCKHLLKTDPEFLSMDCIPEMPETREGLFCDKYPLHPLYIPLSNSMYHCLKQKKLGLDSFHLSGVTEDSAWQSKKSEWERSILTNGFPILMTYNLVDYELEVVEPYFGFLQKGIKTVEGRCNVGKYSKINVGDFLLFNKSLSLQVKAVHCFGTFREMLCFCGLNKVLPNVSSVEEGIEVYRSFYNEEKEKENGVVAYELSHSFSCFPYSSSQPQTLMEHIFKSVDKELLCYFLGMKKTIGTVPYALPLPLSKLFSSFLLPHHPKSKLTVGGRALAKHSIRSSVGFWGSNHGSESKRNEDALDASIKLIRNMVWMNMHTLPNNQIIFEIRCVDGYGARWSSDGSNFRGFLEPPMQFGHEKKWKH